MLNACFYVESNNISVKQYNTILSRQLSTITQNQWHPYFWTYRQLSAESSPVLVFTELSIEFQIIILLSDI